MYIYAKTRELSYFEPAVMHCLWSSYLGDKIPSCSVTPKNLV
jgi:hypothetical protein